MAVLYSKYKNVDFKGQPFFIKELRKKLLSAFSELEFKEDTHTYTFKGNILTPTSNMIKNFYDEFPKMKKAISFSDTRNLDINDVLGAWEGNSLKATTSGTKTHNYLEDVSNAYFVEPRNDIRYAESTEELAGLQYISDKFLLRNRFIPVVNELQMFSDKFNFAGTADMILWDNEKESLCIADWKGLDINTPIFTTKGWSTMGKVQVGDFVFDKDGEPTKILHTSSVKNIKCYKITFDNGSYLVSDNEHRWLVVIGGVEKVITSEDMVSLLKNGEIIEILNPTHIDCNYTKLLGIQEDIDFSKFVTFEDYKNTFYMEVKNWEDKQYVSNIRRLLGSKGFKPYFFVRDGRFFVKFTNNITDKYHDRRIITEITEIESVPTRCIEVESKSHTFLVGDEFIVTHNTNSKPLVSLDFTKDMKPPFSDLIDNDYGKYCLQLSFYQVLLKLAGFKVDSREIVWLQKSSKKTRTLYTSYYVSDYSDRLLKWLNENYKQC